MRFFLCRLKEIVALPNPVNDDVQPPLLAIQALVNWSSTTCIFSPTWLDYGCLDIERFAKFLEIEKCVFTQFVYFSRVF